MEAERVHRSTRPPDRVSPTPCPRLHPTRARGHAAVAARRPRPGSQRSTASIPPLGARGPRQNDLPVSPRGRIEDEVIEAYRAAGDGLNAHWRNLVAVVGSWPRSRSFVAVRGRIYALVTWLMELWRTAMNAIMRAWQCGGQGFESPQLHPSDDGGDPGPTGLTRPAHHRGELAVASAAATVGVPYAFRRSAARRSRPSPSSHGRRIAGSSSTCGRKDRGASAVLLDRARRAATGRSF